MLTVTISRSTRDEQVYEHYSKAFGTKYQESLDDYLCIPDIRGLECNMM